MVSSSVTSTFWLAILAIFVIALASIISEYSLKSERIEAAVRERCIANGGVTYQDMARQWQCAFSRPRVASDASTKQ